MKVSVPIRILYFVVAVGLLLGCKKDPNVGTLSLSRVSIGDVELSLDGAVTEDLPLDRSITLVFSQVVDQESAERAIQLKRSGEPVSISLSFLSGGSTVVIVPNGPLTSNETYTIDLSASLVGNGGSRFQATSISFKTQLEDLRVVSTTIGGQAVSDLPVYIDVPLDLALALTFSVPVDESTLHDAINLAGNAGTANLTFALNDDKRVLTLTSTQALNDLAKYELTISDDLKGIGGEGFSALNRTIYTTHDPTPKFPVIADEALLTLVQQQTFKYFWDFAHPASGMARERNTSGDLVTSGGSGFGIMALIVGIERQFISRSQGIERMEQVVGFLETADRFHGAWSHWINGNTGAAMPFSANDNGGDLVETSLLMQGLLTFRQYLNASVAEEQALIKRINGLWETVEWDWYTRGGQDVLYWHWSPDKEWTMNLPIRGWNESLITYMLAAASPTHGISKSVYTDGWARNGSMQNGESYEGLTLPLGPAYGGPLFFSHYSFLGIDPRGLSDEYANYWTQNVNHTLINQRYCINNPKSYPGYSEECWGLTASDNHQGYSAHSPTNDLGVITPTAALSSFPYAPEASMKALKFFYYTMGDRLWGPYGFRDAFNISEGWVADSYLAIDQGPIIIMIENHRTGLLWELFMSAPEIKEGMLKLGFNSSNL